jgi:zinc D-Ala-D-Ala carboxypeptidase
MMSRMLPITASCLLLTFILTSCSETNHPTESDLVNHKPKTVALSQRSTMNKNQSITSTNKEEIQVVAKPYAIAVLVNKQNKLPDSYLPKDLVYTKIPFIISESERTELRKEAADAIEKLFMGAKEQGIHLLGVSAYRSHLSQVALFNSYVKRDGYEKARTYSALPGTSEHETGLSIDVTEGDGRCSASDCFGYSKEAKWLEDHAAEYGYIIRYPKGKESITGYKYEPWHLRYVGKAIAKEVTDRGITLEEYYGVVPVNR